VHIAPVCTGLGLMYAALHVTNSEGQCDVNK
jgi:hypothetical protein